MVGNLNYIRYWIYLWVVNLMAVISRQRPVPEIVEYWRANGADISIYLVNHESS
jgi:hypothetical protein